MDSSLSPDPSLIQSAQKEVLESYRREFDYLVATFRDLENKAQGTITVSGFALSAALAFLGRKGIPGERISALLFLVVIVNLVVAAICSVLALRVRKVRSMPAGDDVQKLLTDLEGVDPRDLPLRIAFFYGDISRLWTPCIMERKQATARKGRYIWAAQQFLLLALMAIAAILIMAISKELVS